MLPASCERRSLSRGKASKQKSMLRGSTLRARRRDAPMVRFSSTDSRGNSRRPSGTITTPRATMSSVWAPANSWVVPSISSLMLPAVGASRPMTQRISVDLPLPLVPRRATVSPLCTFIERSSMTRTWPYPADRLLIDRLLTEIRLQYFRVAGHLFRIAVRHLAAGHHANQALRERHHGAHDVLDHDDGDALGAQLQQQGDDLVDFRMGKPGHGLVDDQQPRARRHGAGKFQLAHLDLGQFTRQPI